MGPIAGGFMQSSHMMSIATTSASAIAAGQAISAFAPEQREPALFVLVLLTGAMLALMALLKAGRLVRYVPYSVMQGFLFGVSLAPVIELVPMSVLGALMVFAGAASIKPKNVLSVFRTGWMSIAAFMVTLLAPRAGSRSST